MTSHLGRSKPIMLAKRLSFFVHSAFFSCRRVSCGNSSNNLRHKNCNKYLEIHSEKPLLLANFDSTKAPRMNVPEDRRAPTEKELKEKLSSFEYHVLRDGGTERAFTGEYWDCHRKGIYECRACGNPLFSSDTKYDSGTGWPSFYAPIGEDAIKTEVDQSLGMVRTEARCSVCNSHLGHIFPDGPTPTGLRYCMNSVCLKLIEKE